MEIWDELYKSGNKEGAVRVLKEESNKENQKAMYDYGLMLLEGLEPVQKDVEAGKNLLLKLSQLDGNDYHSEIGQGYAGIQEYGLAIRNLETAYQKGNKSQVGLLAMCCYNDSSFEAAYRYAQEDETNYFGPMVLAFLYENGQYVQKSRSRAHEYYCLAVDRGCDIEKVRIKAYTTYYGSASQGNYIVKRLVIALVGSLIIYLIACFCGAF